MQPRAGNREDRRRPRRRPAASFLVLEVLGGFGPDFSPLAPGLVPREQTRNCGRVTPLAPRILSAEVQGAAGGRSPGPADFTSDTARCRRGVPTVPRLPLREQETPGERHPRSSRISPAKACCTAVPLRREESEGGVRWQFGAHVTGAPKCHRVSPSSPSAGRVRGRHPMAVRGACPWRTEVPSRVALPPFPQGAGCAVTDR